MAANPPVMDAAIALANGKIALRINEQPHFATEKGKGIGLAGPFNIKAPVAERDAPKNGIGKLPGRKAA
jgi:hypothetical protein